MGEVRLLLASAGLRDGAFHAEAAVTPPWCCQTLLPNTPPGCCCTSASCGPAVALPGAHHPGTTGPHHPGTTGPQGTRSRSPTRTRFYHPLGAKRKALSFSNPAAINIEAFFTPSSVPGQRGPAWLPVVPAGRAAQPRPRAQPRAHPRMLASQPSLGGNKPQLCLFAATVTGLFPQKVSDERWEGIAPSSRSPGQNKLHFTARRCKVQQAPRSPPRSRRHRRPAAPRPVKSKDSAGPVLRPRGWFRARVCLHLPMSARICVYVCVSVCVRVVPCVWQGFWVCTGVFSHRALS